MAVGTAKERTPDRPGPGPLPEVLLRSLDLVVRRRVEGLLAGDHRSSLLGTGTEIAQVRPYVPGDDVRRIEWNVTARTGETHMRVDLAERVLVTWLALDISASMSFGTAERRKADVAEGIALALRRRRGGRAGGGRPRARLAGRGPRRRLDRGRLAAPAGRPPPHAPRAPVS